MTSSIFPKISHIILESSYQIIIIKSNLTKLAFNSISSSHVPFPPQFALLFMCLRDWSYTHKHAQFLNRVIYGRDLEKDLGCTQFYHPSHSESTMRQMIDSSVELSWMVWGTKEIGSPRKLNIHKTRFFKEAGLYP